MGKGIVEGLQDEFDIEVEHVGFELHPETPEEGRNLADIPGGEKMIKGLRDIGKAYGVEFGEIKVSSNTKKALIVSEYAKEVGKGEEYADAMLRAVLMDGENVGLEETIIEIAGSVGISAEGVKKALTDPKYRISMEEKMEIGRKMDIRSVPTFVINDEHMVVGAQSRESFFKILEKIEKK